MGIYVRLTCGMKRLRYRACKPHTYVAFSMFETTHMYDVRVS